MKRLNIVTAVVSLLVILTGARPALAQQSNPGAGEPYAGMPLCLPDVYLMAPDGCLSLGPSAYLTDLARKGFSYPARPLPAAAPPVELANVDAYYARLAIPNEEKAPVYGTLDEAVSGTNPSRYIAPGLIRYISFTQQQDVNGGHYVMLRSGEWMRASPAAYGTFRGLVFRETPANDFGWIVDQAEIRTAPGYASPLVNKTLPRETIVQIYDMQVLNDTEWYMVGPDEWIEHRYARHVEVDTTPPQGASGDRWIEINLYQQTLEVYDGGRLVFSTLIASGVDPFWTQPGLFKVYQKKPFETMSGAFEPDKSDYYYLEDVPWTMYFDEARALHGAYWRALFGYPQSHGCVNLSVADSRWLFDWAVEGDWVYVYDPSGETPTDPSYYGSGGA